MACHCTTTKIIALKWLTAISISAGSEIIAQY